MKRTVTASIELTPADFIAAVKAHFNLPDRADVRLPRTVYYGHGSPDEFSGTATWEAGPEDLTS